MKRIAIGCCTIALTIATLFTYACVRASKRAMIHSAMDAFSFVLFLGDDGTVYSRNYSEKAFEKVQPGMSRKEVLSLLGTPLRVDRFDDPPEEVWRYTLAPSDRNYFFRIIVFSRDGFVERKEAKYFVD